MKLMEYIRTDRNGTKYYNDWTCPRCGGAGGSDKWAYTGWDCYECGGTGRRTEPKVVKEYTPEHAAKLEARRVAKQAKYEAEHADEIAQKKAEMEKQAAEWAAKAKDNAFRSYGLGVDGIGYILKGDTYPVKDDIKAKGGRWVRGAWVCPVEVTGKGITAKRVDLSACAHGFDTARCIGDAMMVLI